MANIWLPLVFKCGLIAYYVSGIVLSALHVLFHLIIPYFCGIDTNEKTEVSAVKWLVSQCQSLYSSSLMTLAPEFLTPRFQSVIKFAIYNCSFHN